MKLIFGILFFALTTCSGQMLELDPYNANFAYDYLVDADITENYQMSTQKFRAAQSN